MPSPPRWLPPDRAGAARPGRPTAEEPAWQRPWAGVLSRPRAAGGPRTSVGEAHMAGWRRIAAVVLVVAGVVGPQAAPAASAGPSGLEGVPHFDHVVVLTLENESAATTFGPGSPATYLNG